MDETIIFPSPNWFQASVFAASTDNWLIYGGPSKSLCVLEPLSPDSKDVLQENQGYRAHVHNRAHPEKILCVDVSPKWPEKRCVLTGSADGTVKEWSFEKVHQSLKFKAIQSHEIHSRNKEEVVGVGYCYNGFAVTLGCHGQIVKWDLNSNVMKTFSQTLKSFKPVCMACSPHMHLNVAIGTKQGVVFVLDLNGAPRVIYKVRGQDDEITKVVWCPQYEVIIRKNLTESEKRSIATERMEKIRQEPESEEVLKELDERVRKSVSVEHFMKGKLSIEQTNKEDDPSDHPDKENGSAEQLVKENGSLEQLIQENTSSEQMEKENGSLEQLIQENTSSEQMEKEHGSLEQPAIVLTEQSVKPNEELDESGIGKTLPEDSFDQTIASEDDMFDIYVDHEADEFGHKKFQPIDIVVKVTEEKKEDDDFLKDCLKLKEDILKSLKEPESIEALVDALDNTHVDSGSEEPEAGTSQTKSSCHSGIKNAAADSSVHVQKHLLATISKHGSVRVWSKSGKLVGSCAVPSGTGGKHQKNQRNQKNFTNWTTLLWYKPDVLIIADGKNQLLECNALKVDCKAKLDWKPFAQSRRAVYTIATNAPRVLTPDMLCDTSHDAAWYVWTISQDRSLVKYLMKTRQTLSTHNTSGGFLYTVAACPYDARKVAVSVGDGGVRVWEADPGPEEATKLGLGRVSTYWNNVQGKVLTVAWHPTRENLMAFATAESRVGLIDASGVGEKPAKVLLPALSGGVYSLCWGDGSDLYACAGGELIVYHANKLDEAPAPLQVVLEGQKWEVSTAVWYPRGLVCGSNAGAVAVLAPARPHRVLAATFVFSKMIHTIDWHPQQTSGGGEESPYRDLIAVCSVDKVNTIAILEFADKEDGIKQLSPWKTLSGHRNSVLQVAWNPHVGAQLLSTSQDGTVRIWDASRGACVSVFDGHAGPSLGAAWSAFPQLATKVLSGGGDCCLRLWDIAQHPADKYDEDKQGAAPKRRRRKNNRNADDDAPKDEEVDAGDSPVMAVHEPKSKSTSKRFLLPMAYRQMNPCTVTGVRRMLKKHLQGIGDEVGAEHVGDPAEEYEMDYIKLFGNMNELNQLLDDEMERHADTGTLESWVMLCVFRGRIDALVQFANQRDLLDPFILNIALGVSYKYWKDVTQMYIAQIDRLVAKDEEVKLAESKQYGGPVYRKVAMLLATHDARGAVAALMQARLYKEAYLLCRLRYIDSIAEETLNTWAFDCNIQGNLTLSATCFIALGNLSQAATVLAKSTEEANLSTAAEIAKLAGQSMFVDHIEKKKEQLKITKEAEQNDAEELEELPTRVELLLRDDEAGPSTSVVTMETETVARNLIEDDSAVPHFDTHGTNQDPESQINNKEKNSSETLIQLEELTSRVEKLLNVDLETHSVVASETGELKDKEENDVARPNDEARSNGEARPNDESRSNGEARPNDKARPNDEARLNIEPRLNDEARSNEEVCSNGEARPNDEVRSNNEARPNDEARSNGEARSNDETRSTCESRRNDEARTNDETRSNEDARTSDEARPNDQPRSNGEARSNEGAHSNDEIRTNDEARPNDEARTNGEEKNAEAATIGGPAQ